MEKEDGRSLSPGRGNRLRAGTRYEYPKLSFNIHRLTSKGERTLRDLLRDFATEKRAFIDTSTIIIDVSDIYSAAGHFTIVHRAIFFFLY